MSDQEKAKKQKEPWIRQHKVGIVAILVTLSIGIPSLLGTWLRFPAVARFFKLEWLLKDDTQTQENTNNSNTDNFDTTIEDETVVREFKSSNTSKGQAVLVRVTERGNSPTEFEFFHKEDVKPFQSFKYDVAVETIEFDDLNFDGYFDVLLRTSHSVCCVSYEALIFNAYQQRFYPSDTLNQAMGLIAGYELISNKKELNIYYHCPPSAAQATYKVEVGYLGETTFEPIHYYDITSNKEVEVDSIRSVCAP